ncbi:hypothetical protein [Streptomyces platensis]|uniref:hypothetical protein n=1 Tax=Streptomyces platensis TaxID=58346 RepID=UPI00386B7B02
MRRQGSWTRRTGTGLLHASACLLLGALSHVAAGGRLPGAGALGLTFAVLTAQGSVLFGGGRRRFDVVTLTLGGTQFSLHLAFHLLSMPDGGRCSMPSGRTGHSMAGPLTGHGMKMPMPEMSGAGDGLRAGAGAGHSMTAAMTLAHAVATLGTALCVIYGERVLRRLADLVAALAVPDIRFGSPLPVPLVPRLRAVPTAAVRTGIGVLLARSKPRRGPPQEAPA